MLTETRAPSTEGRSVAESVRSLARAAHRVVSGKGRPCDALAVLRRIERLRPLIAEEAGADLGRWLDNLERRVEAVARPA
jgi:hypothetical protein